MQSKGLNLKLQGYMFRYIKCSHTRYQFLSVVCSNRQSIEASTYWANMVPIWLKVLHLSLSFKITWSIYSSHRVVSLTSFSSCVSSLAKNRSKWTSHSNSDHLYATHFVEHEFDTFRAK